MYPVQPPPARAAALHAYKHGRSASGPVPLPEVASSRAITELRRFRTAFQTPGEPVDPGLLLRAAGLWQSREAAQSVFLAQLRHHCVRLRRLTSAPSTAAAPRDDTTTLLEVACFLESSLIRLNREMRHFEDALYLLRSARQRDLRQRDLRRRKELPPDSAQSAA
jgi:hypothetical protein